MKNKRKALISLVLCLNISGYSAAQETLSPAGHNIAVTYELSSVDLEIGDILMVSRTVTNNESFGLTNLYLAENLPFEFSIPTYSLGIDGAPIPHAYSGPSGGEIFPSYNSYRWVIDDPAPGDTTNRILLPGESLVLGYSVTCATVGNYALPFHTMCVYGDTSGIFTVADSLTVTFSPSSRTSEEPVMFPESWSIPRAYPNPFNSEVINDLGNLELPDDPERFTVYNLMGDEVFKGEYVLAANMNRIHWRPKNNVAAGVYFYRLQAEVMVITGKMTFLK